MRPQKYITLPLAEYEAIIEQLRVLREKAEGSYPNIDDITLISPRLYGHLLRAGIRNIGELRDTTAMDWKKIPGFGRKSWEELRGLMSLYALEFKPE